MIELPEALNIAGQINETISGKRIAAVTAAHTPHKLAWYYGDRAKYAALLVGRTIGQAVAVGGLVEIKVGDANILFGEGTNIRFHAAGETRPAKHQLLVEFDDGSALSAAVQMYGGMGAFREGELENPYYKVAREKPSPFSKAFDRVYFDRIVSSPEVQKLSLKALLATEQRIPGLGNGVLQDILFQRQNASEERKPARFPLKTGRPCSNSLKKTLAAMTAKGGRDTESDLFGRPGGYRTVLSKNTVNKPCPVCGTLIKKEAYLGGSIYYCETCQRP